jgi:dTDP-4-dehydrorhamnose reductase
MRILVTGKHGQIGWELQRSLQCLGEVVAVDRSEFDLSAPTELPAKLSLLEPDVIVNAAAYTAVDQAESDELTAKVINGDAPTVIAQWASKSGALLVHYSTDYVFDGKKEKPYLEDDFTAPGNAYGRSKLAGEIGIRRSGCDHLILRTTWIYSGRRSNFLLTMLRLAGERPELRVVSDQIGAPTWAKMIACATGHICARAIEQRESSAFESGALNVASRGSTSWCGFATAILELATERGLLHPARRPRVTPIVSTEYPTPALRPKNSVLDLSRLASGFGIELPDWRAALRLCMDELTP